MHIRQGMSIRLAVRQLAFRLLLPSSEDVNWPLLGDPMPGFAERNARTRELALSGTEVLFISIALFSAVSAIWVLVQRLLFSQ